jgi:microcystin-dependent protein
MAEPFLAEIKIAGFNFAPRGYALCDGQILPINQNQSLYSLLGTIYGGDGRTSFALPDLRSRVPVHKGDGVTLGQRSGEENHVLSAAEIPEHSHGLKASANSGAAPIPANLVLGSHPNGYGAGGSDVSPASVQVGQAGGNQAHDNMQPFLAITFCIAIQGIFPSRN